MTKDHFKNKVLRVDDHDRDVWLMIQNVPKVPKIASFICTVVNILLPGFGTMLAACLTNDYTSKVQLAVGLFQFLSSFLLIGYVWALYWSYLIITKSVSD